ncbi:uncharacterized protein DUF5019 [Flavobacterium croceum DSM 17960]|uniref:Uncharacterized protein DUF5019 n=1 Tax=Flavobacterium croceum DSM 17960 TaxID=1121886 RepID=A0A2S4NAE9_9FLAO|nr:SusE domain-containing protein [Flavobacterium croceum]POS02655.1 uncharacterized protein DUF5019 [Flavobacterium croceum DSM 17960]
MKNTVKLLIAFVGLISLSCTNDIQDTPAVQQETGFKLIAPTSSFNMVLDGAKLNTLATTFVWTDSDNPAGTGVTYTVEAAKAGTNFATTVTMGTTTNLYMDFTVGNLDTAAKTLGLPALVEGQLDVRVKKTSGVSNYATIKVTPYQPNWGIIGSATQYGWNNSTDMVFNPITGKYSITTALVTGEFKFRLDNSWTTNYGDDGNNLSLEPGGANIPVNGGVYTIVLNLANQSYTITPVTNLWGIIGDATPTGWDNDTLMDYDATTQKYSIVMKLKVGTFKFRLNHDWGVNYGDNGNDLSLESGGANIPITEEAKYIITADFNNHTYTKTKI